jgi:hypothetical protein
VIGVEDEMQRTTHLLIFACLSTSTLLVAVPAAAQLAADWMIPAAAHNPGLRGTFWSTDLSLHNPHQHDLPVVVQVLPSDTENFNVSTLHLTLYPWETFNLWDLLGPGTFDLEGTAAILAYADPELACDPIESCHFLATSRTYTPDGRGGIGEYGLTVAGAGVARATDWSTFGYAAGILNDGVFFRCNIGVASWTPAWTTVRIDVQDADGQVLGSEIMDVPPWGHSQRRLATAVEGGSLVFYLDAGPDDPLVFPYATIINQETGDASFVLGEASTVGVSVDKRSMAPSRPPVPTAGARVEATDRMAGRPTPVR